MNVGDVIRSRILKRVRCLPWEDLQIQRCYIGGNSCNREKPNDYDLFPINGEGFDFSKYKDNVNIEILMETKNAMTLKTKNGLVVQLCKYNHPSLEALVDSFDFAHIQIGAELRMCGYGIDIEKVYLSENWKKAQLLNSTFFTGSEYPLSSLMRAFKYYNRENFSGNSIIYETLCMLLAIVKRGVKDYNDFKDQLDAVDLAMVPETFNGSEMNVMMELFQHLVQMPVNIEEKIK